MRLETEKLDSTILRTLRDAATLVLSCPGPARRHHASLVPIGRLCLPQILLGGEAQLLAFAAGVPELAQKMFFAPLPEMFSGPANWDAAWRAIGQPVHSPARTLHLRFGSIRTARVLKGAQNAAVIAETAAPPPLAAGQHPFASGETLPCAVSSLFCYETATARPRPIDGGELPAIVLPPHFIGADLALKQHLAPPGRSQAKGGLDLVALADFQPDAWASGQVPRWSGGKADTRHETMLLPWNIAHPGSIIPELLERLARLWQPGTRLPRLILLPFNDPGQTGGLPALAKTLGKAGTYAEAMLRSVLVGRVTHPRGLAQLRKIALRAGVDGNDPEHAWTLARLKIAGIEADLLPADEPMRIEPDTRFGDLVCAARIPARRQFRSLLEAVGGPAGAS